MCAECSKTKAKVKGLRGNQRICDRCKDIKQEENDLTTETLQKLSEVHEVNSKIPGIEIVSLNVTIRTTKNLI